MLNIKRNWHVERCDVLDGLRMLPDGCINAVVTSPPYYALRSYLPADHPDKHLEHGSEPTPEAFIATMVEVFEEVRRVLRDDGVCWVNLGDSYNQYNGNRGPAAGLNVSHNDSMPAAERGLGAGELKPGDKLNMPHRVAEAMQAAGWYWRDTVIWHKKSPMPESVSGWKWTRCKVKVRPQQNPQNAGKYASGSGSRTARPGSGGVTGVMPEEYQTQWSECPGCAKCKPNDGWVLRRGSWRCTQAHEYVFQFTKAPWIGPKIGNVDRMSNEDCRWLALFLDTEGNIIVRRSRNKGKCDDYSAQIAIGNTNRAIVDEAHRIVGCGNVNVRPGKNAPMYYLTFSSKIAAAILRRVYPYLIVKKRQAHLAMFAQSLLKNRGGQNRPSDVTATLERCWAESKLCNHFGTPDLSWLPPIGVVAESVEYGRWGETDYFCDGEAAKVPHTEGTVARFGKNNSLNSAGPRAQAAAAGEVRANGSFKETLTAGLIGGANPRNVLSLAHEPTKEKHFAAYPSELVHFCLKPSIAHAYCAACGAPHAPMVIEERIATRPALTNKIWKHEDGDHVGQRSDDSPNLDPERHIKRTTVVGYKPSCGCNAGTTSGLVMDPYCGTGTTGRVALKLGARFLGFELNPEYKAIADRQAKKKLPLFT